MSKNLQSNLLTKFKSLLNEKDFEKWPSDELFGEKVEVMIMKGKKMISKDTVDLKSSDEEIIKALKIEGKVQEIKRQKKKFIVILEWLIYITILFNKNKNSCKVCNYFLN